MDDTMAKNICMHRCLIVTIATMISAVGANFNCISRTSAMSPTSPLGQTSISCTVQYPVLVSCGFKTADDTENKVFGGWHSNTNAICVAENSWSGSGVYAVARCCDLPTDTVCEGVLHKPGTKGNNVRGYATCTDHEYDVLTNCGASTNHVANTKIDGAWPLFNTTSQLPQSHAKNTDFPGSNTCVVQAGNTAGHGGTTVASMTCCKSPTYPLTCLRRYGTPQTPNTSTGPLTSSVSCAGDYTMVGCSGFSWRYNVNTWYIEGDTCKARGTVRPTPRVVFSSGICCKVATGGPTTDPTPIPSVQPSTLTKDPSFAPSSLTADPSQSPTPSPTGGPTGAPTSVPSFNPSQTPSGAPSSSPTRQPTNSPSSAPSTSPTHSPSQSPTELRSLYLICRYTDDKELALTYLSLSDYAQIILDAVLGAIKRETLQPTDYNEASPNTLAPWNKGGISDLTICKVFSDNLRNVPICVLAKRICTLPSIDDSEESVQYLAVGIFDIVVDNELNKYQEWITDAITSVHFKNTLTEIMNDKLSSYAEVEYDAFEALHVKIMDPLNCSMSTTKMDEKVEHDPGINSDGTITIYITIIVILVVVIIVLLVTVVGIKRVKHKDKEDGENGDNTNENQPLHQNTKVEGLENSNTRTESGDGDNDAFWNEDSTQEVNKALL
eukprot:889841_1